MNVNLKHLLSSSKIIPFYQQRKDLASTAPGPVAVELHWTSTCNYNCIHCSYGERRKTHEKLDDRTITAVISDLIELNTKGVYLSGGGEPTTVPNWTKHTLRLMESGIEVALITNGVAIGERDLDAINRMNYVAVSVYADNERDYHKITGSSWFNKQYSLPKLINRKNSSAIIGARCVLNRINYLQLKSIYTNAIASGFDYIIFIPAVDYEGSKVSLTLEQMNQVKQEILESLEDFDHIKTNVESLLKRDISHYDKGDYRRSFSKPPQECTAVSLKTNAFINYDGGVYLCQPHIGDSKYCIGNVNNLRLSEIWNSARHHEVIAVLNKEFSSGQCKDCRSINFNWTVDQYQKGDIQLPECIPGDVFI